MRRVPGPGLQSIKMMAAGLRNRAVKVGWFETSIYPDERRAPVGKNAKPLTPRAMPHVAYVAAIHEMGYAAGGIPPRPFMRPTMQEKMPEWKASIEKLGTRMAQGKMTPETALTALGLAVQGDIAKAITLVYSPALKEATIAAKLRKYKDRSAPGDLRKPLNDSGYMLASLTHVVE